MSTVEYCDRCRAEIKEKSYDLLLVPRHEMPEHYYEATICKDCWLFIGKTIGVPMKNELRSPDKVDPRLMDSRSQGNFWRNLFHGGKQRW